MTKEVQQGDCVRYGAGIYRVGEVRSNCVEMIGIDNRRHFALARTALDQVEIILPSELLSQ